MATISFNVTRAVGFIFLAGGADGVYVSLSGVSVGPISAGSSDADTAARVASAINTGLGSGMLVSASSTGQVVRLEAAEAGAAGNALSLDVDATIAGSATPSGPTLSGGVTANYTF